jgi:filamentous hemagglutinin
MTQYVINIGAIPNDGTGDPLRTAFNETNLNFDQVFAAGPVLSNVRIANNTVLTTNTNGNLVLAANGTGVIQANVSVVPNQANLRNLGSALRRWNTVYTQYVDVSGPVTFDQLTVTGNLTVNGNIIQIGNLVTDAKTIQLANTASTANAANGSGITVGANDNIATLLFNSAANTWATNIGLQITSSGNTWRFNNNFMTAPSGATWQSVPSTLDEYISSANNGYIDVESILAGNTAAALHLEHGLAQIIANSGTSQIWTFDSTGNITLPGNTSSINYANGSPYGGSSYGNADVATFLGAFGSNTISTTGNITSNGVVRVNSLRVNQTANAWQIAGNTISAPSGATWTSNAISKDEYITSAVDGYINLTSSYANGNTASQVHLEHGLAQIVVNNGSEYIWAFDDAGGTIFPTLTVTRGDTTGTLTGQALLFGDSTQEALISTPDGVANVTPNSQRLVINPGQGAPGTTGEGGDIYLYAGRGGDTGGSGGDIKIRGGLGPVDGAGGYITMEGGEADVNGIGGYIEIIGGVSGNAAGGTLYMYGGQGRTGGDANVSGGFGATGPGGTVSIIGGASANGQAEYGNIIVATGSKNWQFDNTGNLTLPGATAGETIATQGGYITVGNLLIGQGGALFNSNNDSWALYGNLSDPGATIFIPSNADADNGTALYIESQQSNVEIRSGSGTWNFGNTSNLTLPSGGVVYETLIPGGALTGNTIALKPQGGIDADQQLLIYPTADPTADANHLHLTTGNLYNTELFLGNDNLYVKLANTGNIVINSNDDDGNTAQWTFSNTGSTQFPNSTITDPGTVNQINLNDSSGIKISTFDTNDIVIETDVDGGDGGTWTFYNDGSFGPGLEGQANSAIYLTGRGATGSSYLRWNNNQANVALPSDTYITAGNGVANISILNSGVGGFTQSWVFDATGSLTLPGGSRLRPLGANLDIFAGTGSYVNLITSDESSYMGVGGAGGYVVTAGGTWDFNTNGNLTAPGNISAVGNIISGNLTVGSGTITGGNVNGANFNGNVAFGTGTVGGSGNITGGNLITTGSGGDITMTGGNITGVGNISAGNLIATGNIVLTGSLIGSGASPAPSLSGFSSVSAVTLSATGNVQAGNIRTAGQVSATGNIVTAGNFVGNGAALTNVTVSVAGNIVGTQPNVTLVAGSYDWTFDNTGNLTLPGNTFSVNYANNTPVNAVTRFESFWTVPVGNSTQSFTVSPNETYYLWVDCNIPNGILTWNATATVTNTNVPVVGAQYAWVYNGGGTPIDFTSIPNQFVGTANTIIRSSVAPSATTNRFDFGLNNTSAGNVTVRYGWIAIS